MSVGVGENEETELVVLENGRLKGRFVSRSMVNLSRRELSEEDISLLSKGLKFPPTPTDIDKAQLKSNFEAFNRRMRLRWHFRNNEDDYVPDKDSSFKTNPHGSPLRMTLFLKTIFHCWRRR